MITAIILAAGESKRMVVLKQLLLFSKSTVMGQTLDNLISSAKKSTEIFEVKIRLFLPM